jgi:selenide,water dikinase
LALVCFPEKGEIAVLEQILAGGLSKMVEAGCTVIGGHSIRDEETKFGYSVTGIVHPEKVLANTGAKPGDGLILTKALGTGVISTAIKKDKAKPEWINAAVNSMTTLNKVAAEVITDSVSEGTLTLTAEQNQERQQNVSPGRWAVHALTDITGFGLIGHVRELALGSNVSVQLLSENIPLLPGAIECVRAGYIPGGLKANREFAECVVEYQSEISEELKTLLFDPQTAGGLLISVSDRHLEALLQELRKAGVAASHIGSVTEKAHHLLTVL